ncbi:hypothetical protein ASE86_14630 [Sphingomonas sp. Leaf33]|uniref:asparagine synthase-related protein n=1 Tax=Sphingomonas sp. Leaf33 TaxID=1736215 RepID=UPI0006F83D51|nr:asparagine synthetase B family protein [Sphingomonas sp. Leaf33]KQN21207.1 hypothetical protein ASE86_14630 [Sphingomonas sp. Leaf33]
MTTDFDGIHALASLDGAPLRASDLAVLGLVTRDTPPGDFTAMLRDAGHASPVTGCQALLGHIDEPAALAATLGLAPTTPPADLILAALARYGDDTPMRVGGEWSFLHWDAPARAMTLMVADTARDALCFTADTRRVAVAPHVRTLRAIDGVDAMPDPARLLLHLGRGPARAIIGDRTILRDVQRVAAGTRVRITRDGVRVGKRAELPEPTPWRGSFAEAIEAIEAVLHTILRQQMARHPAAATMLSGGLDSSLVAAFAAATRGEGGSLVALTSAAPAGSGLRDETAQARAVAAQLGIPAVAVVPEPDADAYRLSRAMLDSVDHPLASQRHYVYDALYRAAADRGASAILDGSDGELTVTGYRDIDGWRGWARWLRDRARHARTPDGDLLRDAFHVRLSVPALAIADTALADELAAAHHAAQWRRGRVLGYPMSVIAKNRSVTTATPLPGLRHLAPFRDRRLLTLCAGLPVRFLTHGGLTRAPGRALLAGKVPESIRLRRDLLPFSPDYPDRLVRDAPRARARIAGYAAAGVGDWIDLAWLDTALAAVARGDDRTFDPTQVQATAMAAAFLADWMAGPSPRE